MKGYTFQPNPLLTVEAERSPAMLAMLHARAGAAASAARAIAPVRTGAYRESISAEAGIDDDGHAKGRVNADDFKANWIEFGTQKMPAQAVLRRGAEAAGLILTPGDGGE